MENRSGLVVGAVVSHADGFAERQIIYRGLKRVDQHFKLTMLASNLTRIARILTAVPQGAAQ
jgi:hypothetical protein